MLDVVGSILQRLGSRCNQREGVGVGNLPVDMTWWDRNILQDHDFYHSSQDGKSWGDTEELMGSGVPWLTQLQGATSGHLPSSLTQPCTTPQSSLVLPLWLVREEIQSWGQASVSDSVVKCN